MVASLIQHKLLLKQPKSNKQSTCFDPNVICVVERHGSSVLLQRGKDPAIMSNVSLTRKIEKADIGQYAESFDDEDNIEAQLVTTEPAVTKNTRPVRVRSSNSEFHNINNSRDVINQKMI